uniref:Dolichyl-diphosphooligosaccharide--protein glycosyltransferase subunit DAD1 n=1 Tax=Terrapene triunguis TaxID=2587831 RepID=A0A674JXM9_9SAUR
GAFLVTCVLSPFLRALGSFLLGAEPAPHIAWTGALPVGGIQINPQNKGDFQGISPERAFADFLFASTILHLVVINFVG